MKKITLEGYGRLAYDDRNGQIWMNELKADVTIAKAIVKILGGDYQQIHRDTCGARKAIKYRVKVTVEAMLVDDKEAS